MSLTRARRRRSGGHLPDVHGVEQLEAHREGAGLVAGLHAGVADCHARHAETRADLVVGDEHAVAVGDLDAAPAVAVGGRHLRDGTATGARRVVGLDEELDLACLGDSLGQHGHVVPSGCATLLERNHAPCSSLPGDRGGGFGRGQQTILRKIRSVCVPRGLPHHDPDPRATIAPRRQFLYAAVVEHGGGGVAVLDEHLGEIASVAKRRSEHTLDDGGLDEQLSARACFTHPSDLLSRDQARTCVEGHPVVDSPRAGRADRRPCGRRRLSFRIVPPCPSSPA